MRLYITEKIDPDYLGVCDMCGRPLYRGDIHYRLPDGMLICDEYECQKDWIAEYKEVNI